MPKKTYDYCVLGAGITGLSVAYWLTKQDPEASLAVFDPIGPGAGASGKNAGFLTIGSMQFIGSVARDQGADSAKRLVQFCQTNHELLLSELKLQTLSSYAKRGSISYAKTSRKESIDLIHLGAQMVESSQVIELSSSEKRQLAINHQGTAFLYRGDGSIEPTELLEHLLKQLDRVDVVFGSKQSPPPATQYFVCTNGYWPSALQEMSLSAQRAQILEAEIHLKELPNIYFCEELAYLRWKSPDTVYMGGLRQLDLVSEATDQEAINSKIQNALVELLEEQFGSCKVKRSWSGIMAFSKDKLPHVIEKQNFIYIGGYSGHGMGMAFHLAKKVVDQHLNSSSSDWSKLLDL